jgi:hypothetical protein
MADRAAPAGNAPPPDEAETTPEMIEAGIAFFRENVAPGYESNLSEATIRRLVVGLYLAMRLSLYGADKEAATCR